MCPCELVTGTAVQDWSGQWSGQPCLVRMHPTTNSHFPPAIELQMIPNDFKMQILIFSEMENQEIEIRRRILNVDEIDSNRHVPKKEPNSRKAANYFKNFASNIFPPIKWLPLYRKVYLPGDIISGLTVSMIRLPQVNGINFTLIQSNASQKDKKLPISLSLFI